MPPDSPIQSEVYPEVFMNDFQCVFTAAGISVAEPANLPAGNALRNKILQALFNKTRDFGSGVLDSDLEQEILDGSWKLEFFVGRLYRVLGSPALDVLTSLVVSTPNEAHMLGPGPRGPGSGPRARRTAIGSLPPTS